MKKKLFKQQELSAYDAITEAQKIAYAPLIFQAVRVMRDLGVLGELDKQQDTGAKAADIAESLGISTYGIETLLESGLSCGVVDINDDERYVLTKVGHYLLHDEMTRVNMDYNHYICYQGMYYLDEAIQQQKPAGLKVFNKDWETLYQGLPHLPEPIKSSWYAFDHFYSDSAYPTALEIITRDGAQSLVDIGTNIGKFTMLAASKHPELKISMVDLPDQLANAIRNVDEAGYSNRVEAIGLDILVDGPDLPANKDIYWLSQFLSCFGDDEIVGILKRVAKVMGPTSKLYILETCWDRQQHEAAAYSLINTSLYFTCMASGNSKMYDSNRLLEYVKAAGLECAQIHDNLGICHTLFECIKK
jgi:hypothetical protein